MEVPGKSGGSQEYHELCCEPCSNDNGPNLQAVGFCTVCNEHFCGNCIAYHKKMGFTKDHILLGPEEMPKTKSSKTRSQRQMKLSPEEECVDACDEHKGELVKYFCNDHQKLGCMDCMVLNHGVCNKSLISDISCTAASMKEYEKFSNYLANMKDNVEKEAKRAKENTIQVDDMYKEALNQKDAFKVELQRKLSVLDMNMEKEANTLKEKDNRKLQTVNESCNSIWKDIEILSKEFDILGKGNKKSQQFTLMRKSAPLVTQLEKSYMAATAKNNFIKYKFVPNRSIIDSVETASALGDLETKKGTEGAKEEHVMQKKKRTKSKEKKGKMHLYDSMIAGGGRGAFMNVEARYEEPKDEENCVICMDKMDDDSRILKCGHSFCTGCIEQHFKYKQTCPTCGTVCGIITGDQPDGTLKIYFNRNQCCAGYSEHGRIDINYIFTGGKQGPNHPSPGTWYRGISRTAYLPNNKDGREICKMLRIAFDRRLVFTIGQSITSGKKGVITWNGMIHKTDPNPDTQFGYPDDTYLNSVREELASKGITPKDIPDWMT